MLKRHSIFAALFAISTINAAGQAGDRKDRAGQEQQPLVPEEIIPSAPVLSPEEALESFEIAPGYTIELVASEPLVEAPVAMEFGPDGSAWVVEMTGYMPNVDGVGEDQPVGKVVQLQDLDGDGVMDERTVFLDGLQMPRALALVDDGVLIAEPPNLWFCKDTDGDGRADTREVVDDSYGSQDNPEHTSNGLMWALDNWIYSANHQKRYKYNQGEWSVESTISRGQWGISQDNYGRIYYNSNSDQLRLDLFPSRYLSRNSNYGRATGASFRTTSDQTVWPIRVNPGVNRAYRPNTLRQDDFTLATYTGASGPVVFRGYQPPGASEMTAFIPEPTGNFVRRNRLVEIDGVVTAHNAHFQSEFLASTDERFRPVNLYNGPDGALYIVDFYRGLIQHRIFLTSYLRQQILDRGLELPLSYGRIYRVKHTTAPDGFQPGLDTMSPSELVSQLAHWNGWARDTAQRLLVERGDRSVVAELRELATQHPFHLARLHALWTLEGLNSLTSDIALHASNDAHPKIRAAGARLIEGLIQSGAEGQSGPLENRLIAMATETDFDARVQAVFSLGEVRPEGFISAMERALFRGVENDLFREAAMSSLKGAELELLDRIAERPMWSLRNSSREALVNNLAYSVAVESEPDRVAKVLNIADAKTEDASWFSIAALRGVASGAEDARSVNLSSEPDALLALANGPDRDISEAATETLKHVEWPGKPEDPNAKPEVEVDPLTAEQQQRFNTGKTLYTATCGACHQPDGRGQEGLAPPIRQSEWATGSTDRLIRIVLQGVSGPIEVNGKTYNLLMPGLQTFNDDQLSSLLTYVRREWGHTASPVSPSEVAEVRKATEGRIDMWTAEELLKLP